MLDAGGMLLHLRQQGLMRSEFRRALEVVRLDAGLAVGRGLRGVPRCRSHLFRRQRRRLQGKVPRPGVGGVRSWVRPRRRLGFGRGAGFDRGGRHERATFAGPSGGGGEHGGRWGMTLRGTLGRLRLPRRWQRLAARGVLGHPDLIFRFARSSSFLLRRFPGNGRGWGCRWRVERFVHGRKIRYAWLNDAIYRHWAIAARVLPLPLLRGPFGLRVHCRAE